MFAVCVRCLRPTVILTSPFPLPGLLAATAVSWELVSEYAGLPVPPVEMLCMHPSEPSSNATFFFFFWHAVLFIICSIAVGLFLTNKGILMNSMSHLPYPKRKN